MPPRGISSRTAGVVGRYLLHREIASGGMASVHLGKLCGPSGFAPIVAIKALHAQFAKDPEFVRMFKDEARLAGRVRHRNIVPVLDVYAEEDELLLVLEYIHGESLSRLLATTRRDDGTVDTAIASAIMCDALHGLHAAHEAKGEQGEPLDIVHRDVSPQNIIVGVDGTARVLDFGVAKAAGRMQTTHDGQVKGKFAYMAPEQLRGDAVNRQADVYSAAVVLWEMLTAARLFGGESEGNTVERVLFATVDPPSVTRSDVPRSLDAVVMRGLSRARADRFSTAKEMALALEAAVPPARPAQVGEWVEALAVEALEKRSRLVAEVEAWAAGAAPEGAIAGYSAAPTPAPPVADEGTTSGQALPEPSRVRGEVVDGRHRTRTVALASVAGLAVAALALSAGVLERSRGGPVAEPVAATTSSAPPAVTADPVASAEAPPPPAPVAGAPRGKPAPAAPAVRRSAPATSAARAAPAPGSTARCAHHSADGLITFDSECLRASQRTP